MDMMFLYQGMKPEIDALLNQDVSALSLAELRYRYDRLEAIHNICITGDVKTQLKKAMEETQFELRRTY
jgi:hypothetical protein